MPRKRGSWISTVPSWRDGEEAARELWRGAFRVVPLCRLAMFLNQVRKGVFMVTILLVRAKPRYTGRINFWSMYNMQRFHLFPILFQAIPGSLPDRIYNMYNLRVSGVQLTKDSSEIKSVMYNPQMARLSYHRRSYSKEEQDGKECPKQSFK